MCGGAVEIEVVLLHVLAMISFARSQAEGSLFQNRIFAVPQCKAENQDLISVANGRKTVFSPAVGLASSCIVGQEIPGSTIRTVIFPDSSPGALAYVRTPSTPKQFASGFGQPPPFRSLFYFFSPGDSRPVRNLPGFRGRRNRTCCHKDIPCSSQRQRPPGKGRVILPVAFKTITRPRR